MRTKGLKVGMICWLPGTYGSSEDPYNLGPGIFIKVLSVDKGLVTVLIADDSAKLLYCKQFYINTTIELILREYHGKEGCSDRDGAL